VPCGSLIISTCVLRDLTLVTLDRSSSKDSVRRSSSKGCSRSARPLKTSQAAAERKIEQNYGLEERIMATEMKTKKY
jgi:hypothetical protein